MDWCFDCLHNEGTMTCMPDDDVFYSKAKETLKWLEGTKNRKEKQDE